MVKIATTDRKVFEGQVGKYDSSADIAKGVAAISDAYLTYKKDQEKVKMDNLAVKARVDMDKATSEWQIANQSDPDNPEAKKQLMGTYNSILNGYREQLDPIMRKNWDNVSTRLRTGYDLDNFNWSLKQRQTNTVNRMKDSMKTFYNSAVQYGLKGDTQKALLELEEGYNQMLDNGARILGAETAAQALNEFQENYALNFINGIAESNPSNALNLLNNNKQIQDLLGANHLTMAKKIAKGMVTQRNYENKLSKFNAEMSLSDAVDKAPSVVDKMKILRDNKDFVSDRFYKARMKAIENAAGITAQTKEDKYYELFEKTIVDYTDPIKSVEARTDLLSEIEEAYANGELLEKDARSLKKSMITKRKSAYETLEAKKDGNYTWGWDTAEMISAARETFTDPADYHKAIYMYSKELGDDVIDADVSDTKRKDIATRVFKKISEEKLNDALDKKAKEFVGREIEGYKIIGVQR